MSRRKAATFLETAKAARERLARGPLPPLLVVTGEEPFLKEALIEAAARTMGEAVELFAARPGESDPAACERLLQSWTTATLFGGPRLIVSRGADALVGRGRLAKLEAVLEQATPPHHLLLTLDALDGRSRLARRLRATEGLIALPVLRDTPPPWEPSDSDRPTELHAWVVEEASSRKLRLTPSGARELVARVGSEPAALADRVVRLVDLLGTESPVEADDVARHIRRSSAHLLTRYEQELRAGRTGPALDLLERMLAAGVYDHTGRLVAGDQAADTVLRGLTSQLVRLIEGHEALTPALLAALGRRPWERSPDETAALAEALGAGGRRAFLERDLRTTSLEAARRALSLAMSGLRAARDGQGISLHALTVRLASAYASAAR
ncbi:MAG: DNA polymerase III subunit delta [Planctomycetota bacterium]|jgi:DNA polymerase III delta subunit